ncbi:hypothetical protein BDN72DRAFT_870234 [Pluteus cervinus]|uniref:Uncharacterized protein n=1 Tax=Pluteus cervinus TaxID=181527 RepID=A0ACD3AY09_9AGAR|nr:hypothetical protein BDN72DRAFT_870234 [Pluteus cervinus]
MLAARAVAFVLSAVRLSQAVNVYLTPQQTFFEGELAPDQATSALSRHLGLERFEPLVDISNANYEEPFVGKGVDNILLLTLDEEDVDAVLPDSIRPSFILATPEPVFSLSSVISTYLHRARNSYDFVYDAWSLRNQHSLKEFYENAATPAFAAVELSHLKQLRERFGRASEQYKQAAASIREVLQEASDDLGNWRIAALTFDSQAAHTMFKRSPAPEQSPFSPRPPPQEPMGALSTCFTSLDSCSDATNSCSGRGQCVGATKAGRTCFICACNATKTGEGAQTKTDYWVGESCERKDISGPFVLLTGTVIGLIILIFGSVSLLYAVGSTDLPSTLLSTAVISKRD